MGATGWGRSHVTSETQGNTTRYGQEEQNGDAPRYYTQYNAVNSQPLLMQKMGNVAEPIINFAINLPRSIYGSRKYSISSEVYSEVINIIAVPMGNVQSHFIKVKQKPLIQMRFPCFYWLDAGS